MAEAIRIESTERFKEYISNLDSKGKEKFNFKNVIFAIEMNAEILFPNNELLNANFKNSVFEKKVNFFDTKFKGKTDFSEAEFKDKAFFIGSKFEDSAIFTKAKFMDETLFTSSEFNGMAIFEEVIFSKLVHLWGASFLKVANYSDAVFEGYAEFSETKFLGYAQFKNAQFLDKVFFGEAVFEDYSLFQLVRFMDGVVFNKTVFKGELDLRGSVFMAESLFTGVKIFKSDRESYRIIKHELLKSNNIIDALGFYQKEMICYWESLFNNSKWTVIKGNNLIHKVFKFLHIKFMTDFNEKAILFLNRYSNNYGLSWTQGIKFTVLFVGLPFFLLYNSLLADPYYKSIFTDFDSFVYVLDQGLQYFVQFLNPTHAFDFMKVYDPHPQGPAYIIDGFSRIFITYGYYQTIQAFRKFKFN
ncbi:MAG: pentapeptide repeat-containing protein [Bacteroidales bacterium]|jgi:uncharacterized protein YjbI with pentapeptide repeats|nr:pentapeptide repeat-containing protein [Bacteroidales bacterium]MDD4086462.1 pentapeptide repeat-containing protein [Bacteroidales bacterium]